MNHINAEVLKSTCFSEVWEVRLAEKNYVVDLSDHRKNKSPVLAGLIGMSPERTDCHPRDTGVPGHLFHGRWSLPIWHGKLAGWTLCCFASWLKGNMISAHPDTHAPEASHICEDNGSNHTHKKKQAWSISPEIGARWAQDHELLQLTWGHHSSWESSAPLWDHNQHWASTLLTLTNSQEDWRKPFWQWDGYNPRLRAKCSQRKQGYWILKNIINTFKIIYIIYVLQIEYIFKNIYGTFEIWLQPRSQERFCVCVCVCGCAARNVGFYFPDQEWKSYPLYWKHRDLTTGLEVPRKIFELQKVAVIQICILRP